MKKEENVVDLYYEYIVEELNCKTLDELLGKKYVIGQKFGAGNFSRMKIEEGIEISKFNLNKVNFDFNNSTFDEDVLEVGYCYGGNCKVLSLPDNKEYIIGEGECFIYKSINDIDYFKFTYDNCKTMSIHMNFNAIENVVNPIWKDKSIEEWKKNINSIFKQDVLIIKKATYQIRKIAEEMDCIVADNIMGYMRLKLKTMELLDNIFQESFRKKFLSNQKSHQEEIVIKAKDVIRKNISNTIFIKTIASSLNISSYKLQEAFKNITGNTVYEYIKKSKIERARYLLKNTNMSILQVANEIGYENPSKFSKLFKEYNDITPLKYRKLDA